MKSVTNTLLLGLSLFSATTLADYAEPAYGKKLFQQHCSSCHDAQGGMNMNKRSAPPIAGVRHHYIGPYSDELSFVTAVADWVESPDISKSLMPGAIRKFSLMPKITVSRAEVESIASYIFNGDIETPAGMKEHIEKMHGKHADR
ncbi:MAG: c-type cytochrome [Gammaproteobacteria bacterium]|nr:c-type cytochrome [Gammaproteobacteria bacterium]